MPKLLKLILSVLFFTLVLSSPHIPSLNASIYLYHPETGNIYVNAGENNLGQEGFVNAAGHEMVHAVDTNTDPDDREDFARVVGEGTWDALDNGLYMSRANYGMETTEYNPDFADNVIMTLNGYKAGMIAEGDKENLADGSPTAKRFDLLTMTNGLSSYDQNREAIDAGMKQGMVAGGIVLTYTLAPELAPFLMPYVNTAVGLYGIYEETKPPSNVGNDSGAMESSHLLESVALTALGAKGIADDIANARKVNIVNNPVPGSLSRVVPGNVSSNKLGLSDDVFVTATNDIKGLNAKQIAERLGIPEETSFKIITFPSSSVNNIASPINRTNPGFVGKGLTSGGAREFVIPNQTIPRGSEIWIVE